MRSSLSLSKVSVRIFFFSVIALVVGLVLLIDNRTAQAIDVSSSAAFSSVMQAPRSSQCSAFTCSITTTTVAEFNPGNFYLTGMTKHPQGGGDGDGEVRLLTVGISKADWISVTNGFTPHLFGHAAVQKNGIIYVSGGKIAPSNPTPVSAIYTATIQADHSLSSWQQSNVSLPTATTFHGMVLVGNTLVVIGGADASGNALATVYTTTIKSDGTLNPFLAAASLPEGRYSAGVTIVNGTIYVIGGSSSTSPATNTVFYTTPDPNTGAITAWFTATAHTPTTYSVTGNVAKLTSSSYNGRFYQIGGYDQSIDVSYPYVFFAQPSGGGNVPTPNFTETVRLPINLVKATSATFGGQLYVIGGANNNSSAGVNEIYSAIISPTGYLNDTLGWVVSPVLSDGRVSAASVMSNDGWLYVIGGLTGFGGGQTALSSYDYGPTSGQNASTYAPVGTYYSPIIDVGGSYSVTNISWNTTITTSNNMSLTLQYLCGNSPVSLNLCSAPSSGAIDGMLQTNNININTQAQYWQYVVNYVRGTTANQSPILNWVRLDFSKPPDLLVAGMNAPAVVGVTTRMTPTVFISNSASAGYLSHPISRIPNSPNGKMSRSSPRGANAPNAFIAWVDLYIDPSSPPPSLNLTTPGNCYGSLAESMSPGAVVVVNIDTNGDGTPGGCPIPPGQHTFYVRVDSCEFGAPPNQCYDPAQNIFGRVRESDETNNVGGPYSSGTRYLGAQLFLPLMKK